jgi:anaerobic C4-dicarboxylate transporter DcuA
MEFLAQLLVLFTCLFIGSRLSGIGLGLMGMVGLLVFLFVFGMRPADPPLEVMLIILSVVTAAAALQAAGGMDLLVGVAEKVLRKNPQHITILGPLITYYSPGLPIYPIHSCQLSLRLLQGSASGQNGRLA